jgi:hypothetical protein
MRIAALQVACSKPNGFATTGEAKAEVHRYVNITPEDQKISKTRKEPMYYQIVGNVVCHNGSSLSIFRKCYAVRNEEEDGFTITDAGRAHLKNLGL